MQLIQAALEYLISLLVAGSFLATLTKELGFSDSLTGILSSVISLGCIFQMLSVFVRRKQVKGFVILMSVANQLLFMMLYVIPVFPVSGKAKTVFFVIFIFSAYLIYNFAHPKKINWLMSLVDDHHRGSFTANKEIISLLAGMIFSWGMGVLVDYFTDRGEMRTAFVLSAMVIFLLMILHTLTMVLTPEPVISESHGCNILESMKAVLSNKNVIHVTVLFILYYIATYVSVPFYGTYLINELGFGLKFVSLLSIIMSVVRICISRMWGAYADKTSFTNMIQKCLMILGLGYLSVTFAVPVNGSYMFILYYIFYGIALGGINSALINLVFDYVPFEKRADSLAICQAASGLCGFLATLASSVLVSYIQAKGNYFLGLQVYAQQVVSAIALVIVILALLYIRLVFKRKHIDG